MNTTLEPEVQKSEQPTSITSPPPAKKDENKMPILLILACAVLFSFFLPWIQITFFARFNISGFDLQKEGGELLLLWAVPILAGISIYSTIMRKSADTVGQLAGAAPFAVLAYGLYKFDFELMNSLQIGAYIGLGAGLILFILSRSVKNK